MVVAVACVPRAGERAISHTDQAKGWEQVSFLGCLSLLTPLSMIEWTLR